MCVVVTKCFRRLAVTCPCAIFSLNCCESAAASKEFPALNQGALNMRVRLWNALRSTFGCSVSCHCGSDLANETQYFTDASVVYLLYRRQVFVILKAWGDRKGIKHLDWNLRVQWKSTEWPLRSRKFPWLPAYQQATRLLVCRL